MKELREQIENQEDISTFLEVTGKDLFIFSKSCSYSKLLVKLIS